MVASTPVSPCLDLDEDETGNRDGLHSPEQARCIMRARSHLAMVWSEQVIQCSLTWTILLNYRFITEHWTIEFLLLRCYPRSCRTSGSCNLSSHDISGDVNYPEIHHAVVNIPLGMSSELRCTGDDLCKSGDWIVEPRSLPDSRSPCSRDRYSGTDHLRSLKRPRFVLPGLVSSILPSMRRIKEAHDIVS
ncbi:hypothetical protein BO83DRAFT_455164 [Aspergillus eucalypticola CBS 122712]|uniref:Uncharacterized protein n=1 Tax=Aspergillus eucalypticola (strain CBS 122712 / IBT 29274) TaxID=1448314 RepID=A0A317UUE7_ASPEC|nr:uncharacterized protein BO83DRAFT_455164 [Aspergillus eucalypticola CBS 122712]PWY64698.1 hypothetical protein BO83DRAFT_455164 [Aspergillus eucalypticola CBS 122712]